MLKTSVIVPTYNRESDLENFIRSIIGQTVKPSELIIVDDGNLNDPPLKKECDDIGIAYIYYKKDKPGLTESRNIGVGLSSGDILFFFDDDIILSSDYLEETLKVYKNDSKAEIGGVGGIATNYSAGKKTYIRELIESLFLISSFRKGKVLPSGFCTDFLDYNTEVTKITEVDFLPGGITSYRKKVFEYFSFATDFPHHYCLGEDKDFSYRVHKKFKLLVTPKAKLEHFHSEDMRENLSNTESMYLQFVFRFFKDYVKKGWWSWLFFYYALSGYFFIRSFCAIIFPSKHNISRFKGALEGIKNIWGDET